MNPLINVFVYGTLQPGEVNYDICADKVVTVQPAIALGQLFALPFGYPAMTPGRNLIYGSVLSFAQPEILAILDEFEQHEPETFASYAPSHSLEQNQYQRQQILVFDRDQNEQGTAWTYLMTQLQIDRLGGISIPDGRWSSSKFSFRTRR
jgi:gamma-glutamylcyclotransferase (GGCT)/AIG2-like uncharacterized protein YtfP